MRPRSATLFLVTLLGLLVVVRPEAWATAADTGPASSDPPAAGPGKLVIVLDSSGSMAEPAGGGQSRIDAARVALSEVIDSLPDEQEVALRVFGAEVEFADQPGACQDSQRVVDLGTDNRDELRDAVESYRPFGETPTGHALREAGADLGETGQRSIVLVSDGEPTCAPDPCRVARQLVGDGIDVRIDVVGLSVSGTARDVLECIADAGGGTYYDADDAGEIIDSLTTSAARAARPFDLTGAPVEGTPSETGAPVIGPGQWLDTMPADGALYYRLPRTASGSTLHVGMAVRSSPDATAASARLSLRTVGDGTPCFSDSSIGTVLGMRNPLLFAGGSSASSPDPEHPCTADDVLIVEIEHATGNTEPLAGQPVEIAVYEEPPLANPTSPPPGVPPLDDGAWRPMQPGPTATPVVPGTGLASAPVIGDGTWSADIQPGEAQVFAVPVDWGQDVQFQLDTRVTEAAADAAAVGSELSLTPVGPLRDRSAVDFYADEPPDWTTTAFSNVPSGTPFRTGARSQPVRYSNRTEIGTVAGASVAGLRFVQVAYNVRGDDANLPYTLTVRVNGTAGQGAPEYDDSTDLVAPAADSRLVGAAAPDAPDATGTDGAAADNSVGSDARDDPPGGPESREAHEDDALSGPVVAGGAAALLVLAVLAIVGLARRRRRVS